MFLLAPYTMMTVNDARPTASVNNPSQQLATVALKFEVVLKVRLLGLGSTRLYIIVTLI